MSDPAVPQTIALKRLTRQERRTLAANLRKWRRKLKPLYDAIEASTRLTAEDYTLRINI